MLNAIESTTQSTSEIPKDEHKLAEIFSGLKDPNTLC